MTIRRVFIAGLVHCALCSGQARAEGDGAAALALQEEAAIRAAVEQVAESVVQIRTIGGMEEVDGTVVTAGPTTGLILSNDGWIVSSSFNFVQQPTSILVLLPDGDQRPAELVAHDHSRMLALLKVRGRSDLAAPELADADEVRVGQWAIAVGRTFRADRPNISVGIVSATNRMFGKVLQTDADASTANYGGPLVDIHGRVLGVIVPMAPQSTSEVAGAEWYDSGIGFAAPLANLSTALDRMKQGEDQHAGLLGISLAAGRPHEAPAELAAVLPNGPAGKAGLRKKDRITQIDDRSIETQTDLRFALGPRYAGDEVEVTVARGDEQLTRTLTLAGELESFRHAFLGILPRREAIAKESDAADRDAAEDDARDGDKPDDFESRGVRLRMVYEGSPAAEAGLRTGDRVLRVDGTQCKTIGDAIGAMNAVWPDAEVAVEYERDGKPFEASLRASQMPTSIPAELPPLEHAFAKTEIRELKLAEFAQTCQVVVPTWEDAERPLGVLLWLHAPGEAPDEEFLERWRPICERDGLLLIVPTATDVERWERTELEYLRRLSERVLVQFQVDRQRVVVCGEQGGGAMAYLLALASRDLFTGVATWSAPLPRTVRVPANQPAARLAVFAGLPSDSRRLAQLKVGLKKLTAAGYTVSTVSQADPVGRPDRDDRKQLARWIDTLDRF